MQDQKPVFNRLGTMVDCSRNGVMRPETVRRWAKLTKDIGYNMLMLYTEETYEIKSQPYFGYGRGRYTEDELRGIDAYCSEIGMELIPCIQTLAHLGSLTRWPAFKPYTDVNDILLIDDERTYALIEEMFKTLSRCFTSRLVNVGMDEAHLVGRGKYYDQHGDSNRHELLLRHLKKVAEIGKKYGFTLLMWSDMFFRLASGGVYYAPDVTFDPSISAQIPDNVQLIYWDYYSEKKEIYDGMLAAHKTLKEGAWFAGGLWSWRGFAPHNRHTMEVTREGFAACRDAGVQDVVMTIWGDNGNECSRFSLLPSLYFSAQAAKGETDLDRIRAGFREHFGIDFDDFMLLDLPGTGSDVRSCDPEKYLLYNDPFRGLMDTTIVGGEGEAYGKVADRIAAVDAGEFAPQFRTLGALCRVLEKKAELGPRIRKAYSTGDRAGLEAAANDCDAILPLLKDFYEALRAQWMAENKPHGFEVQEIRLGGLSLRLESCARTIRSYLAGELDRLEELEEPLLEFKDDATGHPIVAPRWSLVVSPCVI